jgi:hypothetical protein
MSANPMPSKSPAAPAPETYSWRAFTTLFIVIGFSVLTLSGVALYATPAGRIANWSGWTLVGLSKLQWQSLHMSFGLLFAVAAAFHLFFNWKVLLGYLRSKLRTGVRRRRELALATAASLALAVLSVADVPPVSFVTDGREALSASWESPSIEPPVPHMELMTLEQAARTLAVEPTEVVTRLKAAGYNVTPSDQIDAVARAAGKPPREIYALFTPTSASAPAGQAAPVVPAGVGGFGSRTLADVAAAASMPVDQAIAKLAAAGIDATGTETLREIASRAGRRPPEIAQVLGITVNH